MSLALSTDLAAQLEAANARIAALEERIAGAELEQAMRERILEEALRQASNIIDLSNALSRVTTNAELLQAVTEFSFASGFANASLLYFDLNADNEPAGLQIIETRTAPGATLRTPVVGTSFRLSEYPITELIVKSPHSVFVFGDAQVDTQLDASARETLARLQIASGIIFPLYTAGRFIGMIFIAFAETHTWNDEEVSLLQTVPNLVTPIVENIRLFKNLESKINELNAALIFKDQFLAIMSHELRTPLNAILGYSSIAATTSNDAFLTPDRMRHMMNRIVANSDRLLKLINSILDLSRINSGRLEIVNVMYDLHQAANAWHDDVVKRVGEKGLEFKYSLDPKLPKMVIGDVERVSQVVTNLLENAIKFTETGEIELRVERKDDRLQVQVRDTGIGISPTWHHLIFEEFRRVEMDSVRKTSGAGLGLSIVQRLCQLMGGTVSVESEVGKGSTFTVILPIVESPVQSPPSSQPLSSSQVFASLQTSTAPASPASPEPAQPAAPASAPPTEANAPSITPASPSQEPEKSSE
ncbi:MAG: GAF domain-containing sensor histidine kinase [Chloroflexi bacterium]|nr:GAF domain-containing sensor histidine kinase [Chloroflexota bacterium]